MGFALSVLGQHVANSSTTSVIPGDVVAASSRGAIWKLKTLAMPSLPVMEALIEAYFDRCHWFIMVFHRPSFTLRSHELLSQDTWTIQHPKEVLAILVVAAIGLQCVAHDPLSPVQGLLRTSSLDAQVLIDSFLSEIHCNLMDILRDYQIESVQVCLLLGAHYNYHGSPSLGWTFSGLAVRTAYALALHCDIQQNDDQIATQVRHRCWNAVVVADAFATMIFGRPGSIDGAFAQIQPLLDIDDTAATGHNSSGLDGTVFHMLKFRLYEIIRRAVSQFRLLKLRQPLSPTEFALVTETMESAEASLTAWRATLPSFFDFETLENSEFWLQEKPAPGRTEAGGKNVRKELLLQAASLHLTYHGAIILINRPLIQYKSSQEAMSNSYSLPPHMISKALHSAVSALLKISRTPISHLENHYVISFAFMQFFIAGVILCIPPASLPFCSIAHEAKSGVMRIIKACAKSGGQSRIAKHSETLLTDLLKTSLKREFDNALSGEDHGSGTMSPWVTLPPNELNAGRPPLAVGHMQQSSNGMFPSNGDVHASSHTTPIDMSPVSQTHTRASPEDRNDTAPPSLDEIGQPYSTQCVDFHGDHIGHIDGIYDAFGQGIDTAQSYKYMCTHAKQ
ncbi:hypothetical protein IFR05_006219 [Cadophora sp. M221]|nr:hypothetical protein IFR05_006219 [Cadophora sp. M221]